jgi:hypothetical protein
LFIITIGENRITHAKRIGVYKLFSLVIIIYFGFRDVGLDIEPYKNIYYGYSWVGFGEDGILEIFSSMVEPLHSLLISLLKSYEFDFWAYLFFTAAIPIIIISFVVMKVEAFPVLTHYFFMFVIAYPAMDAVRHFVAAGIFFGAMYILSLRKIGAYHIVAFISFLAHYSNAITVFLYAILKKNLVLKSYLYLMGVAFLGALTTGHVLKLVLSDFSQGIDSALIFKINYYINFNDEYEYLNGLHFWLLQVRSYFYIFFVIIMNVYILNKRRNMIKGRAFHEIIFNSQVIGSILAVFFIGLGARDFAMRVNFLMSIGSFLLLAAIVRDQNDNFILSGGKFILTSLILVVYNIIILLYLAGIHQPASLFYLG